ncbi:MULTISPECIES: MFS transporter [Cobetia]|uniref:MFS transporter n=1 Tax=Cobetia TaxID=204286 RepID=UPI000864C463|nr:MULTISPECIES: MFS transporter [Cobetia]AOM01946.1 MFS transporter [Cobetia marina]AZV31794.1 MFS transporter [Cobetia sp. ICG0124]MDA5562062.1 MFS transporter [Cobetia sp. MMG027]MDH2290458.1 MFS transporter [Cobetia sp. 10Alg 146]POR08463.1 MFS transporter [Cobetia sp. MM1IDA2H-1]
MRRMSVPLFLLILILVALNLRPALSSLAPLLDRITQDLGLSTLAAGLLTTLPVICLGLFAPLAPRLAGRLGAERTLSLALVILGIALWLRASDLTLLLYLGTLLCGGSIGIAGTLLPAIVKREHPERADLFTGVYTMALCLGAALAAGLSVPLANWLDSWQASLSCWALLVVIALPVWRLSMPHPWPRRLPAGQHDAPRLWHLPLARQITFFMGCQSSLAYIVFGWLPFLLQQRGLSDVEAGWLMAASVMAQVLTALLAPVIGRMGRDQRPAILLLLACSAVGLLGLMVGPLSLRWLFAVLLGFGQGGSFSMALTLLVLRSNDARLAGALSGMAQGTGYMLAALGPLAVGILLEFTNDLDVIASLFALILIAAAALGLKVGRRQRICLRDDGSPEVIDG